MIVRVPTIFPSVRPIRVTVIREGQLLKVTVRETPQAAEAGNLVKFSTTQL